MKDILVFSHMMKTAGTAFSKQLIQYYGKKVHIVHGGLHLSDTKYDNSQLKKDFEKKNKKLKVLIGHPIRPYMNFDIPEHQLKWFTFLRDPQKRYLSHYLHKYNETHSFTHSRYKNMRNNSIIEWEKIDNCSNYQCKFIAGEANAQKAIDIIENKFEWVGLTVDYEKAVDSFKAHFGLDDLYVKKEITNKSVANQNKKNKIKLDYADFILNMNQQDQILYNYVQNEVWPRFKDKKPSLNIVEKSNSLVRAFNMINFQIDKQTKFRSTKITLRTLKRFYERWYKK
jgi:hypothetical protein